MGLEEQVVYGSRVRGCILGGAVGDALGAPVEFQSGEEIRTAHPDGVRGYPEPLGLLTDDTQMTLFTMEGLIRAGVRTDRGIGFTLQLVGHAYQRWYDTQTLPGPGPRSDASPRSATHRSGWLRQQGWLYARRSPGETCLSELARKARGVAGLGEQAANDSKGCGGVMRSAPFGLLAGSSVDMVFDAAAKCAGYTHGHPTGKRASGALAAIVHRLVAGHDLGAALDETVRLLAGRDDQEVAAALELARHAAATGRHRMETVESLGAGWVAEEALAIAVYAALAYPEPDQFLDALALAVTHGGDSDSTGAICGNILGAWHGQAAVPAELVFTLEGRATILELCDDFVMEFTQRKRLHGDYGPHTAWPHRYPPT